MEKGRCSYPEIQKCPEISIRNNIGIPTIELEVFEEGLCLWQEVYMMNLAYLIIQESKKAIRSYLSCVTRI